MKNIIYLLALLFSFDSLLSKERIFGYWLTPGSIVLIENCDNYVCAKIETIFVDDNKQISKMHIVSVADVFGEAIKRIHRGESVSALFNL